MDERTLRRGCESRSSKRFFYNEISATTTGATTAGSTTPHCTQTTIIRGGGRRAVARFKRPASTVPWYVKTCKSKTASLSGGATAEDSLLLCASRPSCSTSCCYSAPCCRSIYTPFTSARQRSCKSPTSHQVDRLFHEVRQTGVVLADRWPVFFQHQRKDRSSWARPRLVSLGKCTELTY